MCLMELLSGKLFNIFDESITLVSSIFCTQIYWTVSSQIGKQKTISVRHKLKHNGNTWRPQFCLTHTSILPRQGQLRFRFFPLNWPVNCTQTVAKWWTTRFEPRHSTHSLAVHSFSFWFFHFFHNFNVSIFTAHQIYSCGRTVRRFWQCAWDTSPRPFAFQIDSLTTDFLVCRFSKSSKILL